MNTVKIVFSHHAARRIKWRKLEAEEIIEAIKNPDRKETTNFGRMNAFKRIGLKLLKVTYIEEKNRIMVISAVDKNK